MKPCQFALNGAVASSNRASVATPDLAWPIRVTAEARASPEESIANHSGHDAPYGVDLGYPETQ